MLKTDGKEEKDSALMSILYLVIGGVVLVPVLTMLAVVWVLRRLGGKEESPEKFLATLMNQLEEDRQTLAVFKEEEKYKALMIRWKFYIHTFGYWPVSFAFLLLLGSVCQPLSFVPWYVWFIVSGQSVSIMSKTGVNIVIWLWVGYFVARAFPIF